MLTYLFCFFVVAKGCFSLSIVEVERIIIIKVTLKIEKYNYAKIHKNVECCISRKKSVGTSISFLLVVWITVKEKNPHKNHLSSEVTLFTWCVGVFFQLHLTYRNHSKVIKLGFFTLTNHIMCACYWATLTLTELRYMRTSSNCLKRKKQEAMHCLPGIVSEREKKSCTHAHTCLHNFSFKRRID